MSRDRGVRRRALVLERMNRSREMSDEDRRKQQRIQTELYNKKKGTEEKWREAEKEMLEERQASEGVKLRLTREDVFGQTGSAHSRTASLQRSNGTSK